MTHKKQYDRYKESAAVVLAVYLMPLEPSLGATELLFDCYFKNRMHNRTARFYFVVVIVVVVDELSYLAGVRKHKPQRLSHPGRKSARKFPREGPIRVQSLGF